MTKSLDGDGYIVYIENAFPIRVQYGHFNGDDFEDKNYFEKVCLRIENDLREMGFNTKVVRSVDRDMCSEVENLDLLVLKTLGSYSNLATDENGDIWHHEGDHWTHSLQKKNAKQVRLISIHDQ